MSERDRKSLQMKKPKYESVQFSLKSSRKPKSNFPIEGESMSLEHLIDNFGDHIPLCFRVVEGFLAENEKDPTLDVDDIYNAHLVKHTDVVTFQDKTGDEYNVPLYSSAKFGIVYNSRKQTFASVGEIMDAVPVPKVVAARTGFDGGHPKSSVKRNEVLVITEVHKPKFAHGTSWLKVFSLTKSEEKKLFRECEAKFTTDPYYTKLYVTDLIQYVPDLLPCKVRLFQDSESTLPHQLTSEEVVLQEKRRNTSVVVSLIRESGIRKENDFIDIPTSIGIEVTVVNPERHKEVYKNLYSETTTLQKVFDPAKLQPCVDARTDDTYVTQAQLLAAVRKDYINVGLEIQSQYQELAFNSRDPVNAYEDVNYDNNEPPADHQVNSTSVTVPTASQRPIPLKRSTPPIKNSLVTPAKTWKPKAQPPPYNIPQLPPKAQSLPQSVLKHTVVDLPADVNSEEHPLRPAVKPGPKKKPKSLPVAQPTLKQRVDVSAQRDPVSVYEGVSFDYEPPADHQAEQVNSTTVTVTVPTASQRPLPLKRNTLPTKHSSPAKSQNSRAQESPYDIPRLPPVPKAQSLPRGFLKHTVVDLPADIVNSGDDHSIRPAVKQKKKTIPAQPQPKQFESVDVNEQLTTLQSSVDELSSRVKVLETQQFQLQKQLSLEMANYKGGPDKHAQDLSSFNSTKIQQLLEVMNLHQYKELFAKEYIDGEVLNELSEDDLANELGMTSKIHRLRLMKVIRGSVSAGDVLAGKVTV